MSGAQAGSSSGDNNDHHELPEEMNINFDSLVKGMEEIQTYALNQHEIHLDNRVHLRNLEEQIESTCQAAKQIKNKNMEDEGFLHGLQCQNAELKQMVAQEEILLSATDKKKETLQQQIDEVKVNYMEKLEEHEKIMSESAKKFRNAPELFSKEKLQIELVTAKKDLQDFQDRKTKAEKILGEMIKFMSEEFDSQDEPNLRTVVEETQKALNESRARNEELKEMSAKLEKEVCQLREQKEHLLKMSGAE